MPINQQMGLAVITVEDNPVAVIFFLNLEGGVVMLLWKEPSAQQRIEPG